MKRFLGAHVLIGQGMAAEIVHYELAPAPASPGEARELMRSAAWCWRRCSRPWLPPSGCARCLARLSRRPCLPMAALYHLSRARELRDLGKRLEGTTQRDFSALLFRAAPPVEAHRPKAVTAPGQPLVSQDGRLSRAGGSGGHSHPKPAPPSTTLCPAFSVAADGPLAGQG